MRADNGSSKNLVRPIGKENLDKALVVALNNGTVIVLKRRLGHSELGASLVKIRLKEPNVSKLWVSVRTPGNREATELVTSKEQSIASDNASHGIGNVSELEASGNISSSIHIGVCGLQVVIHMNSTTSVILNVGSLQVQVGNVGTTASRKEQSIHLNH